MPYSLRLVLTCLLCFFFIPYANAMDEESQVITKQTDKFRIEVHYPVLGVPKVDANIATWADQIVKDFESNFTEETDLEHLPYELKATYEISHPSTNVVSVVWEVGTYTGGVHGNIDIMTRTYKLQDGSLLDLHDLFGNLEIALNQMAAYSYKKLSESLGEMLIDDMLSSGTTPDAENFSCLILIPDGIRIYFPPYQVAPWAAGPQSVDIPLDELTDADPHLDLWGKKAEDFIQDALSTLSKPEVD